MSAITVKVVLFPQRSVTPGQQAREAPSLQIATSTEKTVADLMAAVEAAPGPAADTILLSFDGADLWDGAATLASLGVADGAAVEANVHPDFRGCG